MPDISRATKKKKNSNLNSLYYTWFLNFGVIPDIFGTNIRLPAPPGLVNYEAAAGYSIQKDGLSGCPEI